MMRIFTIFCCEWNKCYFTGFQLNADGVSPVPIMVEAILSMPNAEFPCKVLSKLE